MTGNEAIRETFGSLEGQVVEAFALWRLATRRLADAAGDLVEQADWAREVLRALESHDKDEDGNALDDDGEPWTGERLAARSAALSKAANAVRKAIADAGCYDDDAKEGGEELS
jgi:hypothetical protein